MNGVDEYKKEHRQAWDNFEKDSNLSAKAKSAFVSHLNKFKGSNIKAHAEQFFFQLANQLKGPPVALNRNEIVGRLVNKSAFIDRLYFAAGAPSAKGLSSAVGHLIPSSDIKLKALKRLVGTENLSTYNIMWSFRNMLDPNRPFNNGVALADMPCVLGLDEVAPPIYCMEYKMLQQAHVPTAFDAATRNAWRPGGRTFPLAACRGKYPRPEGMPEVVHRPATFNDIERPFEEIA